VVGPAEFLQFSHRSIFQRNKKRHLQIKQTSRTFLPMTFKHLQFQPTVAYTAIATQRLRDK
jgi:hypothetical protein